MHTYRLKSRALNDRSVCERDKVTEMTAKEIFLELLKEDGRPERQLVQYEALQMALGDPIGGYLHMGRRPGATITDLWGTVVDWPADAPGSMPIVTAENKVIKDITHWRDHVHAPDIVANCSNEADWEGFRNYVRDLAGDDYQVTAVIGDGSFTNGIVYEALNNIGDHQTKMNIILNDNGMSIAHNVGAMHKYLNKVRSSQKYDEAKSSVKSALGNVPIIGNPLSRGIRSSKDKLKYSVLTEEAHIIEALGIKYFGPVDGYNIKDMTDIIKAASEYDGPTLIHVITVKGKGYEWSEKYPRKFHGIGPFDTQTGVASGSGSLSYSKVFGETLTSIASRDDKVVAIAAAMGTATGLLPFYDAHEDRYFDVGIAEEHAVVFAAGMAKSGYKPVVAIYSTFLQRSFDYLIEDIALQNLHVVFAVDRAGLVGADGETHHGIFDLSYLSMIPGMTILAPADGYQLSEMLEFAIDMEGPVAIRYPRGSCDSKHLRLRRFRGSNSVISEGKDVMFLAVGAMLDECIAAAEKLRESGIDAGVINTAVVKPLDSTWADLDTRLVVTVEDNVISGGFGESFDSAFKDAGFSILNIAIPDKFIEHGDIPSLRRECGIDAESIYERTLRYFTGE